MSVYDNALLGMGLIFINYQSNMFAKKSVKLPPGCPSHLWSGGIHILYTHDWLIAFNEVHSDIFSGG